jgi:cytochrome c oxidase assembly factor CtaG
MRLSWSFEPVTIALLVVTAILYAIGASRIRRTIKLWQPLAFAGGLLTLVIALLSPLDELSALLFSAHMTQHELLMIVAAPLLVLGRPHVAFFVGSSRHMA